MHGGTFTPSRRSMRAALAAVLTALTAATLAAVKPAVVTPDEKAAASVISGLAIRADVRFLSDDLLEGRGPGTRGDQRARAYIRARMETLGLEPAAPGGGWEQDVELVGVTASCPAVVKVTRGSESVELRHSDDYIAFTDTAQPRVRVDAAEIVFV